MSGGHDALAFKEEDVKMFLVCGTHLGATNVDYQMEQYVYKRKPDGVYIINLRKTWEKVLLAARAIAAIENPADVCVISARPYGQRAVLKFASATGATPIAGRFTPGTFTNQIQVIIKLQRQWVVCGSTWHLLGMGIDWSYLGEGGGARLSEIRRTEGHVR